MDTGNWMYKGALGDRCRPVPWVASCVLTFTRVADEGDWSSGMIPALGAGGREFDSRITPLFDSPWVWRRS